MKIKDRITEIAWDHESFRISAMFNVLMDVDRLGMPLESARLLRGIDND